MAGWFLVSFFTFFLVISVFLYDPTQRGLRASNIEEKQVLGVNINADERVPLLRGYLQAKDSPLASCAAEMVMIADKYQFDWRLLPAIAGKESSFGKKIPWDEEGQKPSYNAWGWGVYGDEAPMFSSWEEAIMTVAEGLRHEYYNKGYVTPEIIMKKFTPRSDGSWARDVKAIMEQIGSLEK